MKLALALGAAALVSGACVPSVFPPAPSMVTPAPFVTPTPTSSPTPKPEPTPAADQVTTVRVYFLLTLADGTTGLVPVQRELAMPIDAAAMAMQALLDGPSTAEAAASPAPFSRIPAGTRLVALNMSGPVASVELSREFLGGGSDAVLQQMAQVVYTLTQIPTVTSVAISVDRVAITAPVTGGALRRPLKRTDFSAQLPAIFVDQPAWGSARTRSPMLIQGYANVFEAQFTVQIRDGAGTVLAAQVTTATCGSGCWGTFLVRLPYTVTPAQWGTLRVYSASAKDGTPENERIYPIWLKP